MADLEQGLHSASIELNPIFENTSFVFSIYEMYAVGTHLFLLHQMPPRLLYNLESWIKKGNSVEAKKFPLGSRCDYWIGSIL